MRKIGIFGRKNNKNKKFPDSDNSTISVNDVQSRERDEHKFPPEIEPTDNANSDVDSKMAKSIVTKAESDQQKDTITDKVNSIEVKESDEIKSVTEDDIQILSEDDQAEDLASNRGKPGISDCDLKDSVSNVASKSDNETSEITVHDITGTDLSEADEVSDNGTELNESESDSAIDNSVSVNKTNEAPEEDTVANSAKETHHDDPKEDNVSSGSESEQILESNFTENSIEVTCNTDNIKDQSDVHIVSNDELTNTEAKSPETDSSENSENEAELSEPENDSAIDSTSVNNTDETFAKKAVFDSSEKKETNQDEPQEDDVNSGSESEQVPKDNFEKGNTDVTGNTDSDSSFMHTSTITEGLTNTGKESPKPDNTPPIANRLDKPDEEDNLQKSIIDSRNLRSDYCGINGNLSYFGLSRQGTSHAERGIVCQDKCLIKSVDGEINIVIAAIADGIGSCKYSDQGAAFVVCSSVNYLKEHFVDTQCHITDESAKGAVKSAMAKTLENIKTFSSREGISIDSYLSTLTIAVYDGNDALVAHAGDDGAVALFTDGTYELVTTRHKGVESNSLYPFETRDVWEFVQLRNVFGLVLVTDGVLDSFVRPYRENNRVFFPIISSLSARELKSFESLNKLYTEYCNYFCSDNFREIVEDDITFIAMVNNNCTNKKSFDFSLDDWSSMNCQFELERLKKIGYKQEPPVDVVEKWKKRELKLLVDLPQ